MVMQPVRQCWPVGIDPGGATRLSSLLDEAGASLDACATRVQGLLDEAGVTSSVLIEIRGAHRTCTGVAEDLRERLRRIEEPVVIGAPVPLWPKFRNLHGWPVARTRRSSPGGRRPVCLPVAGTTDVLLCLPDEDGGTFVGGSSDARGPGSLLGRPPIYLGSGRPWPPVRSSEIVRNMVAAEEGDDEAELGGEAGREPVERIGDRGFVDTQAELLEEADKAAGGSLDDLREVKPGWWQGERPDGSTVRIEWEPAGHRSTNEGPHVTVRRLKDPADPRSGWHVVDKIFIRGQEKYTR